MELSVWSITGREAATMNDRRFDLIEYQRKARDTWYPEKLLKLWEEVCWLYERGHIGRYELDEMKATIWPVLRSLCQLRNTVERALAPSSMYG